MKRLKNLVIALCAAAAPLLVPLSDAFAIPTLQLDIGNGVYDTNTETIIATGNTFTLYAYLSPDNFNGLSDTYYISAAVSPQVGPTGSNLGSFVFNGNTVNVTSDMTYGNPPLETYVTQLFEAGDLAQHGVFPTFFSEFSFSFNSSNQINQYNTQDRAINSGSIDLTPVSTVGMYYAAFSVDVSNLDPNYVIHFDLYNEELVAVYQGNKNNGTLLGYDVDVSQFAPFSHDAESAPAEVPEPATFLLFGAGLAGFATLKKRISRRG